jgi:hypothetical protein
MPFSTDPGMFWIAASRLGPRTRWRPDVDSAQAEREVAMAWKMKADALESCSCAAVCPCLFGPAKPDQEWCSGIFLLQLKEGDSGGVDLSGAKVLIHFELPGDFVSGIDKGKVVYDTSVSDEQRRELDAIFHGEKGGFWGGMREAIKEWLPSSVAAIEVTNGGSPGAKVEGIGQVVLQPMTTEDGKRTTLTDAPVLAAFQVRKAELASGLGTKLADPDLRAWESLGQGSMFEVEWSG